jgi:hypothetical protein
VLYPEDRRERQFCAPRVAPGATELDAARAALTSRVAALGWHQAQTAA